MSNALGNSIPLGRIAGKDKPLYLTSEMRKTHLYVTGATGSGKSKLLEHMIQHDILNWDESKSGLLLIDPHGSLYDGLINWLAWNQHLVKAPIVPIDLRTDDWTIGYNMLRKRPKAATSVIVDNFVQAMAYVWGVSGIDKTPQFARIGSNVLWTLYEKGLTLLEAQYLINRGDARIRNELTQGLSKRFLTQDWEFASLLSPKDFDAQISSTINRLHTFLTNEKLSLMFGHTGESLDFGKALEEGSIILVNLSTEGARISDENASLFATLLLSDLWTAAKERGKGTDDDEMKPFYVYVDEFQNFITPTIAKNLDQARGYGLHLTLANQFPRQILHAGANGPQVHDSVMTNARSKVVFQMSGEENLRPLALDLFMGVMNPDEIKYRIETTKILDYIEETRTVYGEGENWSDGTGDFTGLTDTESEGGATDGGSQSNPQMWNRSAADSSGTSRTNMRGGSRSKSEVPFLRPVMGKEESSVQFRPLEEQLFRAMVALFDQKQRCGVARLAGQRAPAAFVTPTVHKMPSSKEMVREFLQRCYEKLPYALPSSQALKQIKDREQQFVEGVFQEKGEPLPIKRPRQSC
jgi:hypothetical protein